MAPAPALIRAAAIMLKIYCGSSLRLTEGFTKLLKFVRRVLNNSLGEGAAGSLVLVNSLLETKDETALELLTPQLRDIARSIALGKK